MNSFNIAFLFNIGDVRIKNFLCRIEFYFLFAIRIKTNQVVKKYNF